MDIFVLMTHSYQIDKEKIKEKKKETKRAIRTKSILVEFFFYNTFFV